MSAIVQSVCQAETVVLGIGAQWKRITESDKMLATKNTTMLAYMLSTNS